MRSELKEELELESLKNYIEFNINFLQDQIQVLIDRLVDVQRELSNLKLLLEKQVFKSKHETNAPQPSVCYLQSSCPRCEG